MAGLAEDSLATYEWPEATSVTVSIMTNEDFCGGSR
jgi:hypothetical protein